MTIARLTVSCSSCQSAWRIERVLKPTVHGAPTYCMFCGKPTVGVNQDSDMDADEVLAASYQLTIKQFQTIYALWSQLNDTQTLSDFIAELRATSVQRKAT